MIAEDIDGPSHNHVRYAIVDGNQGSPFTIDAARGELRVARQLDRERVRTPPDTTLPRFNLSSDCSHRRQNPIRVVSFPSGTLVYRSPLHYCLAKQHCLTMLILPLPAFQTSGFTLTVVASDNGVPSLSSSAVINIDISDVNDNPPLFSQANYSLIIQVRATARDRRRRPIVKGDVKRVGWEGRWGGGVLWTRRGGLTAGK